MTHYDENDEPVDDLEDDPDFAPRWPMSPAHLTPAEVEPWWTRLYADVTKLRDRYDFEIRAQWWLDPLAVEVLAAAVAWLDRYDSGEWDDPPGKLSLLYDFDERVRPLVAPHVSGRASDEPAWRPAGDRLSFTTWLFDAAGGGAS